MFIMGKGTWDLFLSLKKMSLSVVISFLISPDGSVCKRLGVLKPLWGWKGLAYYLMSPSSLDSKKSGGKNFLAKHNFRI